jgi:hypothetical protein
MHVTILTGDDEAEQHSSPVGQVTTPSESSRLAHTLTATEGALLLTLETEAEHLGRLEDVMGRHLVRFGTRDELVVEWRRDTGEPGTIQRGEPA